MSWRCNYLWTHVTLMPKGVYKPCCRSLMAHKDRPPMNQSLVDIMNSPSFVETRKQILQGEVPPGCIKCSLEEKADTISLRQKTLRDPLLQNQNQSLFVQKEEIVYLEWFLGPECNLRCSMCHPQLSTAWVRDAEILDYHPQAGPRFSIEPLLQQLPYLKRLKLLGGEPFLTPQFKEIIEAIEKAGVVDQIELILSTNVTIWPDEDLLKRLLKFKSLQISLSVDGLGSMNEYIRYPSRWDVVEKNLRRYFDLYMSEDNLEIPLTCTASAYNVFALGPLYQWWLDLTKDGHAYNDFTPVLNLVIEPISMAPEVLPKPYLEKAIEQLTNIHPKAARKLQKMTEGKQVTPETLAKFISDTKKLDQARGLSILSVTPELAPLFL